MPNPCDRFQPLISGYLDNELNEEDRRLLEAHLQSCPACKAEFDKMARLIAATSRLHIQIPPDEVWDSFIQGSYNRVERKTGWAVFILGAVGLVILGIYLFIMEPWASAAVKLLIAVPVVGLLVIFISVLRERIYLARVDRYSREVER